MTQTFNIYIDFSADLTVSEIWPDGDAPENPTSKDVMAKLMGGDKWCSHTQVLEEWGMMDDNSGWTVSSNDLDRRDYTNEWDYCKSIEADDV